MPSAYLQWRFHSGERVVARGPLVEEYGAFKHFILIQNRYSLNEESHSLGQGLPRVGHFTITGHSRWLWKP